MRVVGLRTFGPLLLSAFSDKLSAKNGMEGVKSRS